MHTCNLKSSQKSKGSCYMYFTHSNQAKCRALAMKTRGCRFEAFSLHNAYCTSYLSASSSPDTSPSPRPQTASVLMIPFNHCDSQLAYMYLVSISLQLSRYEPLPQAIDCLHQDGVGGERSEGMAGECHSTHFRVNHHLKGKRNVYN